MAMTATSVESKRKDLNVNLILKPIYSTDVLLLFS